MKLSEIKITGSKVMISEKIDHLKEVRDNRYNREAKVHTFPILAEDSMLIKAYLT